MELIAKFLNRALVALIRGYRFAVSPLLGNNCRFHPSCSDYLIQAIRTHGVFRGSFLGAWRIARCNPLSAGGEDPVPKQQSGACR